LVGDDCTSLLALLKLFTVSPCPVRWALPMVQVLVTHGEKAQLFECEQDTTIAELKAKAREESPVRCAEFTRLPTPCAP